jgi:hypothetical protein
VDLAPKQLAVCVVVAIHNYIEEKASFQAEHEHEHAPQDTWFQVDERGKYWDWPSVESFARLFFSDLGWVQLDATCRIVHAYRMVRVTDIGESRCGLVPRTDADEDGVSQLNFVRLEIGGSVNRTDRRVGRVDHPRK